MPTTIHIPAPLLERVDTRAKALGISRNRLIQEALEEKVGARDVWSPELVQMLANPMSADAGKVLEDSLAVVSIAGTFVRCRPLHVFCPVASPPSSAFGPPCTLQGPLRRARMNREAEGLPGPVRKLASTIERAPGCRQWR